MADKTYRLTFGLSDGTTQTVDFKAPQGEKGETGAAGASGKDGISPTVKVSEDDTSTTITVTDANGTQTASIPKGNNMDNFVRVGGSEPSSGPILWFDII